MAEKKKTRGQIMVETVLKRVEASKASSASKRTQFRTKPLLSIWLDPAQRGGSLRQMSEHWFRGSLQGHSVDEIEQYFLEFIQNINESGNEVAAKRLFDKLMPKTGDNGGPPLDE